MTEKETMSGGAVWRKRAIASVSVAAAVAAGGVALASAAQAAGTTINLTAPTSVANNGTATTVPPFSFEVNNTGAGNAALTAAAGTVQVTVPAGVACGSIGFTALPITASSDGKTGAVSPAFALASPAAQTGSCTFTFALTQTANSDDTYNYGLAVTSTPIVGNLMANVAVAGVASTTVTVAITNVAANGGAVFAATPAPAPTIYQNYSFTEATSVGTPNAAADFTAFGSPNTPDPATGIFANGVTRTASHLLFSSATDTTSDPGISLNNTDGANDPGFYFDTTTGTIQSYVYNGTQLIPGSVNETDSTPVYTFTIIANNGNGGFAGAAAVPGIGGGSKVQPTPTLNIHDVQSPKVFLPVLFSDVTTASTFGPSIYGLSDMDGIAGFADGTFRPAQAVTRQEFVQIIFRSMGSSFPGGGIVGTGECTTIEPSAFPDVPNASPFCEAIKVLNQVGIIKGGTDGLFHPSAQISREQIAGFTYRTYSFATTKTVAADASFTSPSPFSDVTATNVFGGDIEFLAGKKIIGGFTDGTFHPKATANRGETAAFIYRTQQAAL